MPLDGKKHGGHRNRLRERFVKDGLDGFEEHNILEMLLFYTIPQRDTNEIAHALLDRFGSLEGVFNATTEELVEVNGTGEYSAQFLSMFSKLIDSYIDDRRQNEIISGIHNITEFIVRKLAFSQTECLMIFFIDNKQSVLSWHYLQEVCVFPDNLDKRTIMRMIMGTNTTHVILARNYIKGQTKLRKNDLTVALTISEMFRTIGVGLFDYIVVGRDRSYATLTGNLYMEPPIENKLPKVGDQ